MLQNNGLHACENKIITPFCVIHYFEDLKFFRKTKIWSKIHNINARFFYKTFSLNLSFQPYPFFYSKPKPK